MLQLFYVAADVQRHQLFFVVDEGIWNRLAGFSLICSLSLNVSSLVYKSEEIPVLPHSAREGEIGHNEKSLEQPGMW